MGNGQIVYSQGSTELQVQLGRHNLTQRVMVLDTTAFECVLGMDFMNHPLVNGILLKPARLVVDNEMIPLREENHTGRLVNTLFRIYKTEAFQLIPDVRKRALQELGINAENVVVDVFASEWNSHENLFCDKKNSAWRYDWNLLRESDDQLLWANPPFSKLEKVLTKVALEKTKMIIVTPDWGSSGGGSSGLWRRLLDRLTVDRCVLPECPVFWQKDQKPLPAPHWSTLVSVVDGRLMKEPELESAIVKVVKRQCKGLGIKDLREYVERQRQVKAMSNLEWNPPSPGNQGSPH